MKKVKIDFNSALYKKANKKNKFGETPLHIAAKSGQVETTKRLLKDGAELNILDHNGWQPLHEACNYGHTVVASLLIKHGADINNTENDEHITPLHDAASNGHFNVVKLLINNKASIDIKSEKGETALESLQVLIRCEKASNKKPTGFLEARKRVEAFILSQLQTEANEQVAIKNQKNDVDIELGPKPNNTPDGNNTTTNAPISFLSPEKSKSPKQHISDDMKSILTEPSVSKDEQYIQIAGKGNDGTVKSSKVKESSSEIDNQHTIRNKKRSYRSSTRSKSISPTFVDCPSQATSLISNHLTTESINENNPVTENSNETESFHLLDEDVFPPIKSKAKSTEDKTFSKVLNKDNNNNYKTTSSDEDFTIISSNSAKNSKPVDKCDNNNAIFSKSDDNVENCNDVTGTKADHSKHSKAAVLGDNGHSITHNADENDVITSDSDSDIIFLEDDLANREDISKNDRTKSDKVMTNICPGKVLCKGSQDVTKDNIMNGSAICSNQTAGELNHNEHSDSVLQINIREGDQFLLIPFQNNNEMSTAGWLIDKNKTCIELVRRKVGSPLSPLRPEHNKVIQLNKKFDIFEQKHQSVNANDDEAGPSKSNIQKGEASTVPKISSPIKTLKTSIKTCATPEVKKTPKSSKRRKRSTNSTTTEFQLDEICQTPTKRGSAKKKKQVEDPNQKKIDKWFKRKKEKEENEPTTSSDMR